MSGKARFSWVLGVGLLTWAAVGLAVEQDMQAPCDEVTRARDVMVLDVEDLRNKLDDAQAFVVRHAGNFRLLSIEPEEIHTRDRSSKDPQELVRRARKLGAQKGCDLVVVLKTGPYFGRQKRGWSRNGYGWPRRFKDGGYALVVMGERTR